MNRPIKSRGKSLDTGEFVYGDLRQVEGRSYILDYDIGDDGITDAKRIFNIHYEVDPETVGQFTGVHDDTDEQEELYDGDIAEVEYEGQNHVCKIQYCGSGYMFVADSLPDGYLWLSEFIEFDGNYCWSEGTKKVGNIYTHPHLLEVQA